jgi:putative MATE family efflux protein
MRDLTQGSEYKQILRFAWPMLLGSLFQQLYNVVDSVVVGQYMGSTALAAVGASYPLIFIMISLVIGIASGVTVVISQYFGAKDFDTVKRAIDTMFIFVFVASIVLSIIGIVFAERIFIAIKLPAEIVPLATRYFMIYVAGLILMFGFNGTLAVLRGMGDSMTPLVLLIISSLLNVGLDLLFVLVFGWGVEGVAIATVLAQAIAFIGGAIYLNKRHPLIKFRIKNLTFDRELFRQSIRIGLPTGFQQAFVAFGMLALLRIVNDFGKDTIAAYTVAGRLDSFAALPAMTFAAALSTFVGQNIGAGKQERVRKGFRATWFITSLISVLVTVLAIVWGKWIMRAFTPEEAVISIGYDYLVIVSAFYIVFSTMFVTHGVLRGAGDTLWPMFFTLFSLWIIRIPFSWWLSRPNMGLGTNGIWWGIPAAWVIGLVLSYFYYLGGNWKKKALVRKMPAPVLTEES